MVAKYREPHCHICNADVRDVLEEEILGGLKTQKELAKKYGYTESQISAHKNKHMLSNVKEKLQGMIQSSLLGNMQPQSIAELLKLLEYVNAMQNENFLAGKSEWQKVKESKLEKFKNTIMNYMVPVDDKETIVRIAEICFVKDDVEFGEFLKALIG